ncbi:heme NO-binding domain-containing protein [Amphritea sp. HPY]|uniref:heme NO-binding domain-containing protein n=1 Tax=Amphritea sp. HPY TaxID=3421652 RepID=UPI003D7DECF9
MKGVIFCEFVTMVEDRFGLEVLDSMLDTDQLASGGAYTAVGTYDFSEMAILVGRLSKLVDIAVPDLLQAYGEYMFGHLITAFPHISSQLDSDPFTMLTQVDQLIHVEVAKLYPDAELPQLSHTIINDQEMHLHYQSCRPMARFAKGMLLGCSKHHNNSFTVEIQTDGADEQSAATFILRR